MHYVLWQNLQKKKDQMGNAFGKLFTLTTFGESHGGAVGVIVDGCPSKINITASDIQYELDRRRPGQSSLTTPRKEPDTVSVLSGIFEEQTLGTPICMIVNNKDANPKAYEHLKDVFRPSHADYTYQGKYGIRDYQGGGRSSARETVARVAAGAIAKKCLEKYGIEVLSWVSQVHSISSQVDPSSVSLEAIESSPTRCPDPSAAKEMISMIEQARKEGDSLGGVVTTVIRHVPVGIGEPVFDKLKADLAKSMLSIPATMGFEIGSGFRASTMKGSEHNDPFFTDNSGAVKTSTNNSGGIQGGISNGEDINFRVVFKPTGTIFKKQKTVDSNFKETTLSAKGRHDPCVLPRAVPIVDAMARCVILDHLLRHFARKSY